MTEWKGQSALGAVLAKLVELHARILRIESKKRELRDARAAFLAKRSQE